MAEKKYYWLKLPKDFFRDKAIKKLRSIAGGDTYTIIYLKMLLASLECNGELYFEGVENSISEEIALEIDEPQEDVNIAINFLVSKGLMEVTDDVAKLTRMQEMVGAETATARRVRKHRALHCNNEVTPRNVIETKGNTEKEIEKDKELEKDKKKKKQTAKQFVSELDCTKELKESLLGFIEMRNQMKKPLTVLAIKKNLTTLSKLSSNEKEQIEIVNQSIEHGWLAFYELKKPKTNQKDYPEWYKNKEQHEASQELIDEVNEMLKGMN